MDLDKFELVLGELDAATQELLDFTAEEAKKEDVAFAS